MKNIHFLALISVLTISFSQNEFSQGPYGIGYFDIKNSGIKQTNVKYKAPIVVNFVKISSIKKAVRSPGLIPGT